MKINEKHENHSFCNTFHAKSMKILPDNFLKIIKIDEKIYENPWKFIKNHRKSMNINRKSIKVIENP